jgi:acetyl esterase/lipase
MRPRLPCCAVAFVALAGGSMRSSAEQRYRDEIFSNVSITHDIAYGAAIDEHGELETLTLDLYEPEGDTAQERPVFIYIHGGGFTAGDKGDVNPRDRTSVRQAMTTPSIRLREGEYLSRAILTWRW